MNFLVINYRTTKSSGSLQDVTSSVRMREVWLAAHIQTLKWWCEEGLLCISSQFFKHVEGAIIQQQTTHKRRLTENGTKSLETFFLTFQLEYIHWLTTRLNILNTFLLAHTAFVKNQ